MPKKGDIVVRIREPKVTFGNEVRKNGAIIKCIKDSDNAAFYENGWGMPIGNYREASLREIKAFNEGITNINDIKIEDFESTPPIPTNKKYWEGSKFGPLSRDESLKIVYYLEKLGFTKSSLLGKYHRFICMGNSPNPKISYYQNRFLFEAGGFKDRRKEILNIINKNKENEKENMAGITAKNSGRENRRTAISSRSEKQTSNGVRYIGNKTSSIRKKKTIVSSKICLRAVSANHSEAPRRGNRI